MYDIPTAPPQEYAAFVIAADRDGEMHQTRFRVVYDPENHKTPIGQAYKEYGIEHPDRKIIACSVCRRVRS